MNISTFNKIPLVSISTITFNHAPYIRKCLDSFLMQKTNFAIEILIHDDASTDGTEEIIREYESKYPDIIKPIYEKENQWIMGRQGSETFNFPRAKGKYIAMCEGDDYWIDPNKLQKQVDFMEANPEFGLVHSDVDYYDFNTGKYSVKYNRRAFNFCQIKNLNNIFTYILLGNYSIRTLSVCIRTDLIQKVYKESPNLINNENLQMGDTPLWLELSRLTKFYYFKESMGVYNILPESATHSKSNYKIIEFYNSIVYMLNYFEKKYRIKNQLKNRAIQKLTRQLLFDSIKRKNVSYCLQIKDNFFHLSEYSIINNILFKIGLQDKIRWYHKIVLIQIRLWIKINVIGSFFLAKIKSRIFR